MENSGFVWHGTAFHIVFQQSSICKAAIHYGILDNEGGWVDVTRQGRKNYFIKSYRNGVQSIG